MPRYGTRIFTGLAMTGLLSLSGAGIAHAQFTQNRNKIRIELSSYPPEMRKAYRVFSVKCGECHTLDTSLKPSFSAARWTIEVERMRAMASSHINDEQAQSVLDFLNYDESHRKVQAKSQAPTSAESDSSAPGRQFYFAQSCDTCHSIAGKGGSAGPSLTDVGARLSRDQLVQVVRGMKAGKANSAMPPLPDITDQQMNGLVDFLLTLKP